LSIEIAAATESDIYRTRRQPVLIAGLFGASVILRALSERARGAMLVLIYIRVTPAPHGAHVGQSTAVGHAADIGESLTCIQS